MPITVQGFISVIGIGIKEMIIFFPCFFIFIQAPQTNWVRVIENLDHEGFYLPSEEAFYFLMSVYKHACKVTYQNCKYDFPGVK